MFDNSRLLEFKNLSEVLTNCEFFGKILVSVLKPRKYL